MKLRIALVADALTRCCLQAECGVFNLTPLNYRWVLKYWRPDILLVESAWQGYGNTWKYKIAAYPDYPERNNTTLAKMVAYAKELGIPTVFWNKEDSVHFERFIGSAQLFDTILTVDNNCISRYRAVVDDTVGVHTLMFAVQPSVHHFSGFDFKYHQANFVGSYSQHVHEHRRQWQDRVFNTATANGLGVTAIDRNSDRKWDSYRYPTIPGLTVKPALAHHKTAQIYKDYLVSLNVNIVQDSSTMFSRRLIEILACGGIAVTNPSLAVNRYFHDFCHIVTNQADANELFSRLKHGPSPDDLQRARAGAYYVLAEHTWRHRLEEITQVVF